MQGNRKHGVCAFQHIISGPAQPPRIEPAQLRPVAMLEPQDQVSRMFVIEHGRPEPPKDEGALLARRATRLLSGLCMVKRRAAGVAEGRLDETDAAPTRRGQAPAQRRFAGVQHRLGQQKIQNPPAEAPRRQPEIASQGRCRIVQSHEPLAAPSV